jgi:DNA-binding beta-propeller fold protein YncE
LAIGPDGNLYVTDWATSTVTVVSPAGRVLRRWGGPEKRPGEFQFVAYDLKDQSSKAASIALGPDGKVYVSDSGNARVEAFSPTRAFIRQVGSFGGQPGQFLHPYDVAVDQQGDLYVVDQNSNTISKFSPSAKFLQQTGGPTSTDP